MSLQVPWLIDPTEEASMVLKKFINLKHRLMPYLYATAIHAHKTAVPMMRAMFLNFPDDPISWYLDTQYMLGDNLLVAPIFNDGGDVQYYIPQGTGKFDKWIGLLDGKPREAGRYHSENYDFFSLPLLVRPGGAVVLGKNEESPHYDWSEDIEVFVNLCADQVVDTYIDVPDWERPGEAKAKLHVHMEENQYLTVKVIKGKLERPWKVLTGGKSVVPLSCSVTHADGFVSASLNDDMVEGSMPGWKGVALPSNAVAFELEVM
jgi:alpha-D-xyloside xylohydrolase